MKRFDQSSASCQVFTYKEGLLSAVAYDLRINVTSFVIHLSESEHVVKARFAADSLRVDCVMVDGAERPDALNSLEKEEIERIMSRDVLESDIYEDFRLTSSSIRKDSTYFIKSALTLHGTEREIAFTAKNGGGYYVTEIQLHLPAMGSNLSPPSSARSRSNQIFSYACRFRTPPMSDLSHPLEFDRYRTKLMESVNGHVTLIRF